MGAVDKLVKLATITVVVPPHVRVRNGKREDVDGYTYKRDGAGNVVPGTKKPLGKDGAPAPKGRASAVDKLKSKSGKQQGNSQVILPESELHAGIDGGTGTKDDPYQTSDVEAAAWALGRGEHVQLEHKKQVSTLLNKLAAIVDDAKQKGDTAPTYDLCKVTVPGTNLFCVETKDIPRVKMPQLSGVPTPGSKADTEFEKDEKGEVNLTEAFTAYLTETVKLKVSDESYNPAYLKASQNELNGGKVGGMARSMAEGKMKKGFIWTSNDDYVIDGHHRWAAQVGFNIQSDRNDNIDVRRVDIDIISILAIANRFSEEMGMPHASVGEPPAMKSL